MLIYLVLSSFFKNTNYGGYGMLIMLIGVISIGLIAFIVKRWSRNNVLKTYLKINTFMFTRTVVGLILDRYAHLGSPDQQVDWNQSVTAYFCQPPSIKINRKLIGIIEQILEKNEISNREKKKLRVIKFRLIQHLAFLDKYGERLFFRNHKKIEARINRIIGECEELENSFGNAK
ncbi:hypothetical protein ACFL08_00385 [Patescibacteria group bacterium]